MTWLLVEDDSDIRNVVAVMMTVWGEKPLPFPDGNAAWAWLDSVANGTYAGELPSLALMDIRMPGYRGDEIASRIRQTPQLKDIPIILMTAFSLSEAEIKAMHDKAGIDHLINKPLPDMDVFRKMVYQVRDDRKAKVGSQPAAQPAATPQQATPPANAPATPPAAQPAQTIVPPTPTPAPSQPTTPVPPQPTTPVPPQPTTPTPPQPTTPTPPQPMTSTPATPAQPSQPAPTTDAPKKD